MALPIGGVLRAAWSLAWPFWTGEERWAARALLAAVVVLNLGTVWLNVRLNAWNNDFYNALQNYDWAKFWQQFAIFGLIAASLSSSPSTSSICARSCRSAGGAG